LLKIIVKKSPAQIKTYKYFAVSLYFLIELNNQKENEREAEQNNVSP
jgi:hypothetical protein